MKWYRTPESGTKKKKNSNTNSSGPKKCTGIIIVWSVSAITSGSMKSMRHLLLTHIYIHKIFIFILQSWMLNTRVLNIQFDILSVYVYIVLVNCMDYFEEWITKKNWIERVFVVFVVVVRDDSCWPSIELISNGDWFNQHWRASLINFIFSLLFSILNVQCTRIIQFEIWLHK